MRVRVCAGGAFFGAPPALHLTESLKMQATAPPSKGCALYETLQLGI